MFRERHGLDYVSLRYSTIYGPGMHRGGLTGGVFLQACEDIARGLPPRPEGGGADRHDYLFVDDAARASLLAMPSHAGGEAVTIATGTATTTRDALATLMEQCGAELPIEAAGPASEPRPAEARYDVSKARRLLGWSPRVEIADGMRRLAESLGARIDSAAESSAGAGPARCPPR
jgi:UDP-glucose 4-epimerase